MAMTLTGVLWEPRPMDKSEILERVLATVDAFLETTAHDRGQVVLEHEYRGGRLGVLPFDELHLSDALDLPGPVDVLVVPDLREDPEVRTTIEVDNDEDTPQVIVAGSPDRLDARALLLRLVEIWDATMGFHTDDPLLEVTVDMPVPVGKYTWLAPGYDVVLTGYEELAEEEAAGGMLFTFGAELGSAEILAAARSVQEQLEA